MPVKTRVAKLKSIVESSSSRTLGLSAGIILLTACGSTPPPPNTPVVRAPVKVVERPVITTPDTPEQLIQKAQLEWQQSYNTVTRNSLLLTAADGYTEQHCNKTLTILNRIYPEITESSNKIHADLLIAECSSDDQLADEKRAELVSIPASTIELRDRQKLIQAQLFANQQQWLAAAQVLAQLSEINEEQTSRIWGYIKQVDYRTQQKSMNRYPNLRQWLSLSAMLHRYGTSSEQLAQNFEQFSRTFPNHPLVQYTPEEFSDGMAVTFTPPIKVAAVLPLSGRLEVQGNAIKQGILAAYFDATNDENAVLNAQQGIRFYDSNALNTEQLAEQLQDAELIIGPLLKSNIEALTPRLPASAVLVALNRVDLTSTEQGLTVLPLNEEIVATETTFGPLPDQRFYFGLAPEDEAQQMAEHIYQQGYRTPVLVHAQDAIGQRLAAAFLSQWRALTPPQSDDNITVVSYTDNDAMRDGITSALDVAQSKNRIKQLERQLIPELYNVPRNRRDVDAIVAFATPEQTELLNPIVESSLSPFSEKDVPVYVTSRSISLDITKNQLRDLQNVHFLDLPWMMPDHEWRNLSTQVNTLYPNQRDSTKRLFALGYDAFAQVAILPHLAAIPQLSANALSGELSVNQYQQVIRKLPMAVIDNEEVKVLVER